jgi:short-subunit dehydrogenase
MKDNVVMITGASKGIGAEMARQLAAGGARIALAARDLPALEQVAAECRARGATAEAIACDVTVDADCRRLAERTVAAFGRIDTLVNNAGATMWARFDEITDVEALARIMDVNYMGAVRCTHHALPHLKASRGRLAGIASLTGLTGVPTRSGYAASKHAMRGFFDSLRIELEDSGVSVTMVYPGFVATGIRENCTGADGKPALIDPVDKARVMSVQECTRLIVRAIETRKREEVMTMKGKFGQWLRLIAPKVIDGMAKRAVAGNQKFVDGAAPAKK